MSSACRKKIGDLWPTDPPDGDLPDASNAALIRDRYLRVPVKDPSLHPDARKGLFRTMQSAVVRSEGIYRGAYDRYVQSPGTNVEAGFFKTKNRMILGLGNENVLETGLTLHHTYGTPMIPGTALKGLAAHYCDQVWGWRKKDKKFKRGEEYHMAIFGTTEDAGHIIFHDAWITPETLKDSLRPDVMTPHHGDYYSGKNSGTAAPTDFDDPNPVTFLSVSGTFHIAVSCDVPEEKQWTSFAFELLADALREWGIGGKTGAGYGRLETVAGGAKSEAVETKVLDQNDSPTPRYTRGKTAKTTRDKDPRGRGRPYFIADDGIGGFVARGDHALLPEQIGEPYDLEVISYSKADNLYSFAIPGTWKPYQPSNPGRRD